MTIESTRRDQQPSKEVLSKGDDCALRRLDKDRQRHHDDATVARWLNARQFSWIIDRRAAVAEEKWEDTPHLLQFQSIRHLYLPFNKPSILGIDFHC